MATSSTRFMSKLIAIISSVAISLIVLVSFAPALAFVSKTEGPSVVGNFQLVSEKKGLRATSNFRQREAMMAASEAR